ncbi:MAG: transposase [Bacillota bacterium]
MEKKKLVSREQLKQFIKENNLKTTDDVQDMLRDLFSETLQEMLEAEMDHTLGYEKNDDEKNDAKNKETDNRRNGHSRKTVRSEYGDIELGAGGARHLTY